MLTEPVHSYGWPDIAGNIGVALIVVSYFLMQIGRLDARSRGYAVTNAAGAGLVILSLMFRFNLSAFLVEAFWLLISVIGLLRPRPGR
jgi:hypothetical protein